MAAACGESPPYLMTQPPPHKSSGDFHTHGIERDRERDREPKRLRLRRCKKTVPACNKNETISFLYTSFCCRYHCHYDVHHHHKQQPPAHAFPRSYMNAVTHYYPDWGEL
eukprot:COSAG06_NODE_1399_length_9580_cov_24.435292_13_plen_110_part_00